MARIDVMREVVAAGYEARAQKRDVPLGCGLCGIDWRLDAAEFSSACSVHGGLLTNPNPPPPKGPPMVDKNTHRKMTVRELARARIDAVIARRLRGKVVSPIPGYPVTYKYGVLSDSYQAGHHTGEDHSTNNKIGVPVQATSWGTVVEASSSSSWGPAYGTVVVVEMSNGRYRYGFCHLSRVDVKPGDPVRPGTIVGASGDSGNSTGPHLHFEARRPPFRYGDDVHPIRVKKRPVVPNHQP